MERMVSLTVRWIPATKHSSLQSGHCTRISATLHNEESSSARFPPLVLKTAALRFQESNRPDPLFIDPYVGCFLKSSEEAAEDACSNCYGLGTRYIDDLVVDVLSRNDDVRQVFVVTVRFKEFLFCHVIGIVKDLRLKLDHRNWIFWHDHCLITFCMSLMHPKVVLLTDGIDTRPYRLRWPQPTLIFGVSPGVVFKEASKRLEGIGAKVSKQCVFLHVAYKNSNLQDLLCQKGFNGTKPSIWVLQGLPIRTLSDFQEILFTVSSLATKGCIFVGELPLWLVESKSRSMNAVKKWMNKMFMSNGFRVEISDYQVIAEILQREPPSGACHTILFVAHQLQFSDGQLDKWRAEFQRIEEEGDEEGFVDMLL